MQRPILKRGDPHLHTPCETVTDFSGVSALVRDMWDTLTAVQGLYEFTRGSGLAAPQIGSLSRISVVDFGGERLTLINPEITGRSAEKQLISEGCLSFFNWRGMVLRSADVVVDAFDAQGDPLRIESGGNPDFSSLLQHELDHLDGRIYPSAMPPGEDLTYRGGMPRIL